MAREHPPRQQTSLLSYIRFRDAVIFQSPCIVGLAIFFPALSWSTGIRAFVLAVGSFLLMAYIFAFNDWTDLALDSENAQKHRHTYVNVGISGRQMFMLAAFLAVVGLLLVAALSATLGLIALLIVIFGLAYSFPVRGLKVKGIPVLSSCLHFAGTVITFLLGSAAFSAVDTRALLIASYFGVLITAGHLVQEVQDYADDRLSGIRTNAVQFGQKRMFILAFILFGLSFVFLVWLSQTGLIPAVVKYTAVLFLVYAAWAIQVLRRGLSTENVRRLRNQYRMLFAVVVFTMLVSAILQKAS